MEPVPHTFHIGAGTIIKTILIVALFYALFLLKDLVLVVLLSIVIASSVEPVAQWFVRRRIPRLLGVILIYISAGALLAWTVFYLLIPLLSESADVIKTLPAYLSSQATTSTSLTSGSSFVSGIQNTINIPDILSGLNTTIDNFSSGAFSSLATVFGGVISFLLMIILSFYLSVDEHGISKFLKIITPLKHEPYVLDLWRRSQGKIGLWMQGQLILAIIIGMLVFLGLTLLSVPNALLLAFLAGMFEIIPLFGPILASIPAVMIAFVSPGGGISLAVGVIGLYLIIHQFENQLIYPLVVKKVTGVPPVVSIIALAAGWSLAGFLGLLLSVPLAAVLIEFFEDIEKNKMAEVQKMNK